MRYKFDGSVGKQEILEKFSEVLNSLEDAGVNEFQGVNLYFNPCISGQKVRPHFDGVESNFVSKSTQKHVDIEISSENGKKIISHKTGVKGCDMNLDGRIPYQPQITLPTKQELEASKERLRKLAKEASEKQQAEYAEKFKLKQEAERDEKNRSQACVVALREQLGLSVEEFKYAKSSVGWIKTEKNIHKYCEDLNESTVFRISIRIKDSKEKKVYLFSDKAILLYEGVH
ncbi:hypothetical protein AB4427_18730 [Vibrio artabrorum]|uniref:hypothetical protein n=1 Tax=Vibrio artabrorum TaxID=446374 RepID=UPI003550C332